MVVFPLWRHQMETFSPVLAICAGNWPVTGEFPAQRPVTRSFDVFFDLHPNKRLSKQSWGWWFETPLWRHTNAISDRDDGLVALAGMNRTQQQCSLSSLVVDSRSTDLVSILGTNELVNNRMHGKFSPITETEMSSFWWHFHHWLHWKLSFWQLPVQLVMKISSKWQHFRFSDVALFWGWIVPCPGSWLMIAGLTTRDSKHCWWSLLLQYVRFLW